MKAKNERTSARVAMIAGRILQRVAGVPASHYVSWPAGDLKALSASVLTQAPDKPKRKAAK